MDHSEKRSYRDLFLTILLLAIVYWFWPRNIVWITASTFLVLGLLVKPVRIWNHFFWKSLTQAIQWVMQPIIGALLFFLVLTPIGLLSQVFKKKQEQPNSTFKDVAIKFDKAFFEKQW